MGRRNTPLSRLLTGTNRSKGGWRILKRAFEQADQRDRRRIDLVQDGQVETHPVAQMNEGHHARQFARAEAMHLRPEAGSFGEQVAGDVHPSLHPRVIAPVAQHHHAEVLVPGHLALPTHDFVVVQLGKDIAGGKGLAVFLDLVTPPQVDSLQQPLAAVDERQPVFEIFGQFERLVARRLGSGQRGGRCSRVRSRGSASTSAGSAGDWSARSLSCLTSCSRSGSGLSRFTIVSVYDASYPSV